MRAVASALRNADLRVSMLLLLLSGVAVVTCSNEVWFSAMAGVAILWLALQGRVKRGLQFALAYVALCAAFYYSTGVRGLENIVDVL